MSEAQAPDQPASTEQAPPATETAEAKAKRGRTSWPIRIFTVESTSPLKLALVAKAPEFADADKAAAWIKDKGDPSLTYAPARVGPGLSPTVGLKETTLFKTPAPAAEG